jgi:anaerobic magnesium-protoporphyrin IX monomethyl ester cyclase
MQSKILLINPPRTAIGDRLPQAQLPSSHLFCMCSSLVDAGFAVEMLDAEYEAMSLFTIARETRKKAPQLVWILGSVPCDKDNGIAKILMAILKVSMPRLSVTYRNLQT